MAYTTQPKRTAQTANASIGTAAATSSLRLSRRQVLKLAALAATSLAAMPAMLAGADEFSASPETEAALADAQSRYNAALEQISYLNNQVFDAEARYTEITDALNATIQQIADLQASIDQKQVELDEAQDALADRVAANYRAGTTGMLDVILSASDFDDFVNRVFYANRISDSDAQMIQDVKDIKASLEADQAALVEQQAQQEQLQAEQAAQIETLNAQVAEAEAYASSLDGEVQALIAQRDAEIAAAAEAARIAAEQEAARQAAEAQAAAEAGSGGDASTGAADTGTADTGGGAADTGGSTDSGGDTGSYDDSGSSSSGGDYGGGGGGYQPASVVAAAYNYIGTPYSVMDCSGLTSQAYADCGYYLYHQSGVQYNTVVGNGNLVGADGLVPGNLVFYARGGSIYHVALYIGDGYVIDSIPNGGVQVRSMYFCDGFCGGGSPL